MDFDRLRLVLRPAAHRGFRGVAGRGTGAATREATTARGVNSSTKADRAKGRVLSLRRMVLILAVVAVMAAMAYLGGVLRNSPCSCCFIR